MSIKIEIDPGPEQLECFTCDSQFDPESIPKYPRETLLKIFLSFSNVQLNLENILENFTSKLTNFDLCLVCSNKLNELVKLQDQMTQLNLQMTLIKTQLKCQLVSKFTHTPSASDDLTSLGRFLAQCWSDCKVKIQPLTSVDLQNQGQTISSHSAPCPARFKRRRRPQRSRKLEQVATKMEPDPADPDDLQDFSMAMDEDPPEMTSGNESHNSDDVTFDLKTSVEASKPKKTRRKRLPPAKFKDFSRVQPSRKDYTCRHCKASFKLKKQLKSHLATIHNDSHLPTCKFCGLDFNLTCRLPNNPDGTVPSLPFFCHIDSCSCKYKTVNELRKHHHTKCLENPVVNGKLGKKFSCDLCDRSYVHMTTLRYHVHTVHEKKFKLCCEECGEGFQAPAQLKAHKIMHSSDRKFVCQVCNKSFKRSHELFYHRRTHTGETPYTCEVCGKGFRIPGKLRIHAESVHGESKYPCEICGKMFRSKAYVYMHVQATHNGQYRRSSKSHAGDLLEVSGQDLGAPGDNLGDTGEDLGSTGDDLVTSGEDLGATGQDLNPNDPKIEPEAEQKSSQVPQE